MSHNLRSFSFSTLAVPSLRRKNVTRERREASIGGWVRLQVCYSSLRHLVSSAVAFLAGRPTLLQIDVCEGVALQGLNNESLFGRKANNNLMFVNTEHQSPSQTRLDSFGVVGFR